MKVNHISLISFTRRDQEGSSLDPLLHLPTHSHTSALICSYAPTPRYVSTRLLGMHGQFICMGVSYVRAVRRGDSILHASGNGEDQHECQIETSKYFFFLPWKKKNSRPLFKLPFYVEAEHFGVSLWLTCLRIPFRFSFPSILARPITGDSKST